MQNLVIVESPTKAKTLSKYLGSKYQVEASMGHIRDLPKSELGIDVEDNFEPKYIIPRDKTKLVNELKKMAVGVKTLWLATDPDREGEAIAWHLAELLRSSELKTQNSKLKTNRKCHPELGSGSINIHRVVFHEITPEAIAEAFRNPRGIDLKLVDAQQARRVLDRLVGYKVSPVLWKKVRSGLSAGRVQSVALRLIVEREKEIEGFKPIEYWSIEAELSEAGSANAVIANEVKQSHKKEIASSPSTNTRGPRNDKNSFIASLIEKDGKRVEIKNKNEADGHLQLLEKANYQVEKVIQKEIRKSPPPPFTTSTIQQTAANRLGMSAKRTMTLAQTLYEHGMITYMRTDSVNLSPQALTMAREFIEKNLGKDYLPAQSRVYKTKSKLAQEAHEAIRPTNINLSAEKLKTLDGVTRDHLRLYDLIWKRMLASQIAEAVFDHTTIDVTARCHPDPELFESEPEGSSLRVERLAEGEGSLSSSETSSEIPRSARNDKSGYYTFRATGSVIKFDGWLKVYGKVQEEGENEDKEQSLPKLAEGELLKLVQLLSEQHFTEPPARYNDASLIKKLEELGIGRPSTYATILSTIQERFYVEKTDKRFFATPLGMAVTDFLVKNFSDIVDYTFTAAMEDELDDIAKGERQWKPTIKEFYVPFEKNLEKVVESAERVSIQEEVVDKKCPDCGKNLQIKYGKFGKFLACSGFPDCKYTESLEEKIDVPCPDCGGEVVLRKTKKGRPFYGCKNYPNCKFASWNKPKSKVGVDKVIEKE
ncbi:MAG: type I DNA topoisomerase [Patescibacteria group bacterium]|nr:type I DNA topoisomerase [Patescibacteria group bacterium]